MKKLLSLTMIALFAATSMFAQGKEKPKSPHETVSGGAITIDYGRPYKKGRDIFGGLEPYGQVWRTGADSATHITLSRGGMINRKQINAGTYSLFTIPGKTEWTIILNKNRAQWGAYTYDKNKDQDVLTTTVPVKQLDHVVEQFTITPKADGILMEWDKTSVFIPTKF